MGKLVSFFGFVLFISATVHVVLVYGEEWEFSPRGIPVTALSPDGETYRNGRPVDPMIRQMHESGFDEKLMGVLLAVLLVVSAYVAIQMADYSRLIGSMNRSNARDAVYRFAKQLEEAGRLNDAEVAYDFHRRKLAEEEELERRGRWWRWMAKSPLALLRGKRRA